MSLRFDLFLICAVLFCSSEVKSDCDDFISCFGMVIGDFLVHEKREAAAKAVDIDTLSDVGEILKNISQLIVDQFDGLTKETSLLKADDHAVIHVDTYKVNDSRQINNSSIRINSTEAPHIVEYTIYKPNDTNKIINNISINVILNTSENQTTSVNLDTKTGAQIVTTEKHENAFDFDNVVSSTTNSWNYSVPNDVTEDTNMTNKDNPFKVALGGDYLNHNISVPKKDKITNNISTDVIAANNVTNELPVNIDIKINNDTNIEKHNTSEIYINIPKDVASNYKITFESPINVTYLEINTEENKLNAALKTNTNTDNFKGPVENDIEHQNITDNEIIVTDDEFDYNSEDGNAIDYLAIDYIDIYKDTTNEDVGYTLPSYTPTTTQATSPSNKVIETHGVESTYPWIATVFIKNNDNNQFEYICDGGVLSNKVVLTAARCVMKSNKTEDASNILVILGKRSLQATGPNEKVLRVKSVKLHENCTTAEGKVDNDLAIIILAEPIVFNDDIQAIPWKNDDIVAVQSATTGWHVTGGLTPIFFNAEGSKNCKKESDTLNIFCATFGDDITTCPSFGGLYVSRAAEWSFQGIVTGNPTSRGVCFNKDVSFTNITNYYQWIVKHIDENKH